MNINNNPAKHLNCFRFSQNRHFSCGTKSRESLHFLDFKYGGGEAYLNRAYIVMLSASCPLQIQWPPPPTPLHPSTTWLLDQQIAGPSTHCSCIWRDPAPTLRLLVLVQTTLFIFLSRDEPIGNTVHPFDAEDLSPIND
jgi:hypothetical protein